MTEVIVYTPQSAISLQPAAQVSLSACVLSTVAGDAQQSRVTHCPEKPIIIKLSVHGLRLMGAGVILGTSYIVCVNNMQLLLLQYKEMHTLTSLEGGQNHISARRREHSQDNNNKADCSNAEMTVSLISYEDAFSDIVAVAQQQECCLPEHQRHHVSCGALPTLTPARTRMRNTNQVANISMYQASCVSLWLDSGATQKRGVPAGKAACNCCLAQCSLATKTSISQVART